MTTFRMFVPKRHGRSLLHFRAPQITPQSVIHISATEASEVFDPPPISGQSFFGFIGDASITVQNVSPGNGDVDFIVFVDFSSPLNVVTDITIMDPPEQIIMGT